MSSGTKYVKEKQKYQNTHFNLLMDTNGFDKD